MSVREIDRSLEQWQMGVKDLRRRMILAPTPRERERWYAMLLLAQGWTAAATAEALERDPHTIGRWASAFGEGGPAALMFEQTGGSPPDRGMYFILRLTQLIVRLDSRLGVLRYKVAPKCLLSGPFGHSGVGGNPGVAGTVRSYNLVYTYPCQGFPPALDQAQQEELKGAVQQPPATSGIELANWYWKVVRQYVSERFGISLSRSSCLNWLHRLGFAFKRPKRRLLKANESRREAFVAEYAALGMRPGRPEPRSSLPTRPTSVPTPNCGASGCSRENPPWWTRPVRATERRPATARQCAWRRGRWSGWNWRATATPQHRLPS